MASTGFPVPANPRCTEHTVSNGARGELPDIPYFCAIVGHDPYPWQQHFYAALVYGEDLDTVDIPTGLGKTLCVLLALLAGLANPSLPRRIVYIVDRRAIVDQTAQVIRGWIERIAAVPALARAFNAGAAFPADRPVGLGVLRGGLADDGAWRVDPARPAVVVGTVDMIGSRLLFSGYGDGRTRRPTHAGLLGHDALVLLDEAHLAPAFGALLRAIARLQNGPEFRTLTMSATGGDIPAGATVLGLTRNDLQEPAVLRRLRARKSPHLLEVATPARRIRHICDAALAHRTGAILVFVESVADARRVCARLVRALGRDAAARVALLTGTLRGRERAALAGGAVWARFDPSRERTVDSPSVYLVATAAGEVGVDLDADHAVMDLTTLDSTIQRLGRVNRVGVGDARVTIVFTAREAKPLGKAPTGRRERLDAARRGTLEVLRGLADLCPGALRGLDTDTVAACSAPSPEPARLDRVAVEAFAATSVALPLPPVAVYLRGVDDATDVPQCLLAWRSDVPDLVRLGPAIAGEVLAFHRLRPEELARVPAPFAEQLVRSAIRRQGGAGLPVMVVRPNGEVLASVLESEAAAPSCAWTTMILPPAAGGLTASGLPDAEAAAPVADVADSGDRIRYVAPYEGPRALLTRSAQYTGAFGQELLGLSDTEWKTGAGAGLAPTPAIDVPGGILVRGEIVQQASVMVNVLRRYRTAHGGAVLPTWLLGLALGGLLTTGSEYHLRSGCALVPAAPGEWTSVSVSGERARIELAADAVVAELRDVAREWAEAAGVTLAAAPTVHRYDETMARRMVAAAQSKTAA